MTRAGGADTRILDVRWACRQCGRFIAESAIESWDEIDPGAYYGVVGHIRGTCTRCGLVDEPSCVAVREVAS